MILELAEIDILPGKEAAFESVLEEASGHFLRTPGCLGMKVTRSMEHPHRFRLLVQWESVDAHMVGFRNSDAFLEWRRLAGPCFAKPPRVEHLSLLIDK
ncbi:MULTISPECIES: antibiotic biosynthesis monooxygenase family protein [Sphingomonadales]|uniref:Antibiotic biosynthesis monooxygenase n=2 Tax=Edaphosphingomonas TaxID=3423724 RepID=A0A2T4I4C7_9SPHN|nr:MULTISPECIES: antibiotic biosynthesis monooxygenase family protein [Sphingomonas]AGH50534.1 antibiotic biosynthesis monooxygenase [Sphingomonas sp. MM-1]MDX3883717.1 antibiotic biosynthesis monooxygenase [Sphingomonas sp.]OHT18964.1 Antibiotic biosynthesis monooxygenase [Sphingomonas haloaromaticamans]PTD24262.1 antibiotic biosynthesis monooxygenase [Sphingomonas fennica]